MNILSGDDFFKTIFLASKVEKIVFPVWWQGGGKI
jgi:hypothetical protein